MRLMVGLLALLLVQSATAQDVKEKFGQWELQCIGPRQKIHCVVRAQQKKGENEWISIEVDFAYTFILFLVLPHTEGAQQPGLLLKYGPKQATRTQLRTMHCTPSSCIFPIGLSDADKSALLRGSTLTVYVGDKEHRFEFSSEELRRAIASVRK